MSLERTIRPLLPLTLLAAAASGQTITVTTAFDVVDVPSAATIADLPGPDGLVSLREALRASDNEPGHQTIGFAIPEDQRWLPNIFPEFVLLQGSFAFGASDTVTIDGTTQTAFGGDINPDGHEIVVELGVGMDGDGSELFGFHGTHVGLGGNNGIIHDNTGSMRISVGPFNSGCVIRDNEADTIELTYSDDNVVIRNTTERVRITGLNSTDLATGNRIGGPDPADRNYITGWGNVGEHGSVFGVTVELYNTDDTLIQNNYIGTNPDGMSIGNNASTVGVGIYNSNHNLTVRDNLIAIQSYWGGGNSGQVGGAPIYLQMYMGGSSIRIFGNTLGLNALGEPVLGSANGIWVGRYAFEYGADDVRIGGPNPGEGNIIAGHRLSGVVMEYTWGTPIGYIRLSGNSIYANGEVGIDLMPDTSTFGPTPNDPLDADVGANGLQNYPDVLVALLDGGDLRVAGSLHSEPLGEYTLEFFASPACDTTGFGPAQVFLGRTTVFTDPAGNATFSVMLPPLAPEGWVVTSTATSEPLGTTSELSACRQIRTASQHFVRSLRRLR